MNMDGVMSVYNVGGYNVFFSSDNPLVPKDKTSSYLTINNNTAFMEIIKQKLNICNILLNLRGK